MQRRAFSIALAGWMIVAGQGWLALPVSAQRIGPPSSVGATRIVVSQAGYAPAYPFEDNGPCVSDFSSHYGVKCDEKSADLLASAQIALRSPWGMPGYTMGECSYRFYLLRPGEATRTPTSQVSLGERRITYLPYGWKEEGTANDLRLGGETFFVGTDQLFSRVTIANRGKQAVALVPVLHFWGRPTVNRGREPTASVFTEVERSVDAGKKSLTLSTQGVVTATRSVCGPSGVRYWEHRVIRPGFEVGDGVSFTREPAEMDSYAYECDLPGRPVSLKPGEQRSLATVIGFARDDLAAASQLADQGEALVAARGGPAKLPGWIQGEWQAYFNGLPRPHTRDPAHVRMFYQAATAVRMNLYGPIARMRHTGSVPVKGFYDAFYAWDTAFQALGYTVVDPRLAEESLLVQFDAQLTNGCVPNVAGEDGGWSHEHGPLLPGFNDDTQAPVQGWAILHILDAEPDRQRLARFVQAAYPGLCRYVEWWRATRDVDHNHLVETHWRDDTEPNVTRWEYPKKTVATLAYNGFLYACYEALERMARFQGSSQDAERWRREGEALSTAIDTLMWDESDRFWYTLFNDDTSGASYRLHKLPYLEAAIIPAVGASRDPAHVRSFVDSSLANPARFFGACPMPTLAQDHKEYDPNMWYKGRILLIYAYPGIVSLYRYGREQEASQVVKRLLDRIANNPEGIYESYHHATGKGDRCWQFSWSSHMILLMLTESWQRERILFDDEKSFSGHVRRAIAWRDRTPVVTVETGAANVPWLEVQSEDEKPLLESHRLRLRVKNPYPDPKVSSAKIGIAAKGDCSVERLYTAGRRAVVPATREGEMMQISVSLPAGGEVMEYVVSR
jgi:hypothetical protein